MEKNRGVYLYKPINKWPNTVAIDRTFDLS